MAEGDPTSSQGSTVAFGGTTLGRLRSWRVQPGTATFYENTNVGSTVVGEGATSAVVRSYNCYAIDPGGVDVSFWGVPPWSRDDIGMLGTLSVSTVDGPVTSRQAWLETFDSSGNVGEFVVGTARFKFSGT